MNDNARCPKCGVPLPANSLEGLCPRCLMHQALAGSNADASSGLSLTEPPRPGVELTVSLEPASSSVLARIAESIGGLHHVLLRDSEIETGPGPILKPSSPEIPEPAQRPNKYQLFGEIARGGMGAVLRGRDIDLGRDLAVKVLLDSHKDKPELVRRFVEEAQIGGQLQHPGVVPIYELGSFADRRPFFTMKLVKGRTLAELLRARAGRGSPGPALEPTGLTAFDDLPRFLSIFESAAQTVAYAHARGVIHRDLKPSNIMVGSFGEVQVMDWGLAKVLPQGGAVADEPEPRAEPDVPVSVIHTARARSGADDSENGSVLGTPGYMAPEQARGEIEAIDERTDVFGLGAILCEVLTGEPAFVGRSSGETLRKAGRGELAEAFALLDASGAEPELIALAKDCLAPERADRPRRAGVVVERITAYLTGVQERLRKAELARVEERARRRLTMAVAGSVVALLIVGAGGWGYFQQLKAARRAAVERVVSEALDEANVLRGQARSAAVGETSRLSEAMSAAKRAHGLLAGGESGETVRARVLTVLAELKRELAAAVARADQVRQGRELLDRLESIQGSRSDQSRQGRELLNRLELTQGSRSDHWDEKRADADYAAAFREIGVDLDRLEPSEAGERLRGRAEPVELASYLDDWASGRCAAGRPEPEWRRLVQTARRIDPDQWRDAVRANFGGQDAAATAAIRALADDERALESQPAASLVLLARQLNPTRDRARAEVILLRAWRQRPDDFWVNYTLGWLHSNGNSFDRPEEAVRFYSIAVAIRPRSSAARTNLGTALRSRGDFAAASAEFRKALELANGKFGLSFRNRGELMQTDHEADLAARLLAIIRGDAKPNGGFESLELAYYAHQTERFAAAAQLFAEALRSPPWWTGGLIRDIRYHAACCAALASAGKGKDEKPLDEKNKARWRTQAVEWLKADLAQSSKQAQSGKPEDKSLVGQTLQDWKSNADLAGIRDETAVNKLPEDDKKACRALWAAVEALLTKVEAR